MGPDLGVSLRGWRCLGFRGPTGAPWPLALQLQPDGQLLGHGQPPGLLSGFGLGLLLKSSEPSQCTARAAGRGPTGPRQWRSILSTSAAKSALSLISCTLFLATGLLLTLL